MSLLTDTDLVRILIKEREWSNKEKLHIYPYDEDCLTPVGYDVRVGNKYASAIRADSFELKKNDKVIISPGDTVLITTLEKLICLKIGCYLHLSLQKYQKYHKVYRIYLPISTLIGKVIC